MAEFPAPKEGIVLTQFIVSNDVERSRRWVPVWKIRGRPSPGPDSSTSSPRTSGPAICNADQDLSRPQVA
jgi:hypothetical protein